MTKPASVDYLALGTNVLLAVRLKIETSESGKANKFHFRPLAASDASELRFQALIIWNKEVCD